MSTSTNIIKTLGRGAPVIILFMAVCIIAARTYVKYATPMYESTARIKLADSREGISNTNLYKNLDLFATSNKIGAEIELLRSEVLVGKMLDLMHIDTVVYRVGEIHTKELYKESPVLIHATDIAQKYMDHRFKLRVSEGEYLSITLPDGKQISGKLGVPVRVPGFMCTIVLNELLLQRKAMLDVNDNYEFAIYSRRKLTDQIISGIDVTSADKDVPVLRVSYRCPDARKAAEVVNAIAAVYIKDYIEEKARSADTTEQFLDEQLQAYSDMLGKSENNVQSYRDANNIVNIRQETETDLRKIADLKKQLASVQMNLLAIDSLNDYMQRNHSNFVNTAPNFEAFTDLLSTEMIKKVKLLQAEKRDLLLKYTPQNPKVTAVDDKIADMANYLQESIHNTQTNLRIKYNDLRKTIDEAETAFIGLPQKEKDMTILERDFGMNEQIYRFIREKRTEAQIAKAATISFHRIISRGEVPEVPVSPNGKLLTVFSGFLGLVFGIITILLVQSSRARVASEENIYRSTATPLEKSIPQLTSDILGDIFFDRWVLEMELGGKLAKGSAVCVSSTNDGEGRSYTANMLTKAMARLGKRTLLVAMEGGLVEIASDDYDVASPAMTTHRWRIPIEWNRIMDAWKQEYDVIIIRNFALRSDNAGILPMAKANMNLVMLDSRNTRKAEIAFMDDLKEKLCLPAVSMVLNRAGYAPGIITLLKQLIHAVRNGRQLTK